MKQTRYGHFAKVFAIAIIVAISMPNQSPAQDLTESALDYHVGFAALFAVELGELKISGFEQTTVDNVTDQVASYFFRAQSNLDDVVSAKDTYDYFLVFSAISNYAKTRNFARYDLNRDGITTQHELEVSQAKRSWITASSVFTKNRSYADVREYFDESIAARTTKIRSYAEGAPQGNLDASETTLDLRENVDRLLKKNRNWGPPYFAIFDLDKDAAVTFAEYFDPVAAAIATSDTDGDGIFSEAELDAISIRFKAAKKRFDGKRQGQFSFADPQ